MDLTEYTSYPSSSGWFVRLWFFSLGACIGSFLNVCIDRIPVGRSVIRPSSHCKCGKAVAWYAMVPVLSWLLLWGKARCCGVSLPGRYPLAELLMGLIVLTSWEFRAPVPALIGMGFGFMLLTAAFIDWEHFIIPDILSIGLMVAGISLSFSFPELHGYTDRNGAPLLDNLRSGITAITGAVVGSGVILWIALLAEKAFKKEAMGMGDVKFLGGIGAFCGWQGALFALFGGAVLGTALLLPGIVLQRLFRKSPLIEPLRMKSPVPFGPLLATAALLYYLFLQPWADAYMLQLQLGVF